MFCASLPIGKRVTLFSNYYYAELECNNYITSFCFVNMRSDIFRHLTKNLKRMSAEKTFFFEKNAIVAFFSTR